MPRALTKRQREILDYIEMYIHQNRYSPTLEEICGHFGLSSVATVHKHLTKLAEKGVIRRLPHQSRTIELVPELGHSVDSIIELPLLGQIAAGEPIEAIGLPDSVSVPAEMVPRGKRTFVLRVKGESMIEEQICDGDYVVVAEAQNAENGKTVVALVDEDKVTLKKFFQKGETVRLEPANRAMQPITLRSDQVKVQGIVVGLIRRYK